MLIKTILFVFFFVFGLLYWFSDTSSLNTGKSSQALQIRPLKKNKQPSIEMPIQITPEARQEALEVSSKVDVINKEVINQEGPSAPRDPYQELRARGGGNINTDTSSYVESAIKLDSNLDQEKAREAKADASTGTDPYAELRENSPTELEKDTSEYVESVVVLKPPA